MYKKMIEEAKAKGITTEKMMWESVDDMEDMLCMLKKEHPEKYWGFIRKQHGILYGNHYSEDFAMWDVEQMKPLGMYWTKAQIEEATRGMVFPTGTTMCDKFVAFNAFANDLKPEVPDDHIIKAAYKFWFCDKDWKGKNKIWEYMALNYSL